VKRRPARLPRSMRDALQAASVATWTGPRTLAARPGALVFAAAPGHLPAGHRVYAIGDVHGELAALRTLHRAVAEDLAARPVASAILIHLGDLIDHGPDSAGVVAWLAGEMPGYGLPSMTLRGDHEQMLLDALDGDRAAATDWLHAGGAASLRSWGIAGTQRQDWPALLPPAHVAFLHARPLSFQVGSYLFACRDPPRSAAGAAISR
ncbi:MAG TPA: metallophosphoesterase, partial [Acetobacteraceae bacterium]|nr:metallophosphoesterase [Acetobacteraceae bacterium]